VAAIPKTVREHVPLEARPYGPDSTPAEIEAIRGRVYLYREQTLMYVEVPVVSAFQMQLFRSRFDEVTAGMNSFDLIIDLRVAKPPGAEARGWLRDLFGSQKALRRVAVFTGRNFMLNVAAKFVLGSFGMRDFTVHTTLSEAVASLRMGRE
jgi:hypothetical protein